MMLRRRSPTFQGVPDSPDWDAGLLSDSFFASRDQHGQDEVTPLVALQERRGQVFRVQKERERPASIFVPSLPTKSVSPTVPLTSRRRGTPRARLQSGWGATINGTMSSRPRMEERPTRPDERA
jgi:hypothetical protein